MLRRFMILGGFWWIALAGSGAAQAQTCSASMGNIVFGNVNPISGMNTDVSGPLNINCSGLSSPYVRLCVNLGLPSGGGTWTQKTMKGPTATALQYAIYQDAAYSQEWTSFYDPRNLPMIVDVPLSSDTYSTVLTYYARVPSGQTGAPAGSYTVVYTTGDTLLTAMPYSSANAAPACSLSGTATRFSFSVNASVAPDCTLTASNIDFGQFGVLDSAINSTGMVSVTCTYGLNYALSLDAGQGPNATVAARQLSGGGNQTLLYNLYSDAGRTQIWGDGSNGTGTVSGSGTGTMQTRTIYAALPVQPNVPPGSYMDTIIVTVTY